MNEISSNLAGWGIFPYEQLTIKTYLSPEAVHHKLAEVIEPRKPFRAFWSRDHKPYQGQLEASRFEVSRIIHYRNSFLPTIKGEIRPDLDGTALIDITMYPHLFVIVFMIMWLGFAGLMVAASIFGVIRLMIETGDMTGIQSLGGVGFSMFFLLFGYAIVIGGFKFESSRSKSFLQNLFG